MKRTAVSIVLAVAALAMLVSLVLQSRSLPLEVHLSQNTIATEVERVSEDFAALVATLEAARREVRDPGDAAASLLNRVTQSGQAMRQMADVIPGSAGQRDRLARSVEGYVRTVADIEALAERIADEQRTYAQNVN